MVVPHTTVEFAPMLAPRRTRVYHRRLVREVRWRRTRRNPLRRAAPLQRALAGLEDAQHLDAALRIGFGPRPRLHTREEVLALAPQRLGGFDGHRRRRALFG